MPNEIQIRDLDLPADGKSLQRVWREIGWSDSERSDRVMLDVFAEGSASVGTINDEVECAVLTQPGTMRLDQQDLPLCVVAAVTTSRIARGLSLAQKLTCPSTRTRTANGCCRGRPRHVRSGLLR
jgi:hypothetical protein